MLYCYIDASDIFDRKQVFFMRTDPSLHYLDNAATSHPKPACTLRAVQDAMTRFNANPGRAGHARSLAAGRLVLETGWSAEPMRVFSFDVK